MRLSDLEQYNPITIQCHDNPDADTLGAGFGLYCYFYNKKKEVSLIYSGHNQIKKTNLKLMIEKLSIPVKYVPPEKAKHIKGLLITVDCQYGAGNVTKLTADAVAVIDHHPLESENTELLRIQSNMGSCTTLVWSMLLEENFQVNENVNLGTALYYGLYADTNQFSELFNPLDMDMCESITYNKNLMKLLRNSNISLQELEIAGIAMSGYHYNADYHFAVIKSKPCDPNVLGLISDFLLQVDEVDTCLVYNEVNGGYKLSIRSCIKEVNANELAVFLTDKIGSGGGHYEKAGGFISKELYEQHYPTLHSEAYFNNRMSQYFDLFEIIYAKDFKVDIHKMDQYKRREEPICYLKATEFLKLGSHISIRNQDGSMEYRIREEAYFILERDGSIRYLTKERFEKRLVATDEKMPAGYCRAMEYAPTIKDWTEGKTHLVEDYAKLCMPREDFYIYVKELDKGVKVFPKWDDERYMLGMPGDYLAVSTDDLHNIFIESGKDFKQKFQITG